MSIFNLTNGGKEGYEFIDPPTVTVGTYTYDGSEQGPKIVYADGTKTKIQTTNETKTAAGTYTLTFSVLNSNKYVWSDGTTADKTYTYTINKRTVTVTAPTVNSSTLTYNGSAQTLTGNAGSCTTGGTMYYYTSSYTQSTAPTFSTSTWSTTFPTAKGTNAGTYYIWYYCYVSDTTNNTGTGINTAKSITKAINKKASTITLSKSSMTLDINTMSDTFTVTYNGDGTLSVVSSDSNVATVIKSGSSYLVEGITNGTATITVSATAGTNYSAPTNKTLSVTVSLLKEILNDNKWDAIGAASQAGTAPSTWNVGDRKAITLNGTVGTLALSNVTLYAYIIDITEGKKGITFGTFKSALTGGSDVALVDSYYGSYQSYNGTKYFQMNHWGSSSNYNTNYGGWAACDMRYDILGSTDVKPNPYGAVKTASATGSNPSSTCTSKPLENTLMAALPSELRGVMQRMTVYSDNKGNSSNTEAGVSTTEDYLPLLAEWEVFGTRSYANQYEHTNQTQYKYYANGNSKVKNKHNDASSACYWWLRSACYGNANNFCRVNTNGNANNNIASTSIGLAPAFQV